MLRISFLPGSETVEVEAGVSVRDAAIAAGVDLVTPCGGWGICGKCAVKILSGDVRGEVDEEGYYPACRTFPLSDCMVEIPELAKPREIRILQRGRERGFEIGPALFLKALPSGIQRQDALGMAVDLGTATVVGALVVLESAEVLAVASRSNPQSRYGEDVISRIGHASDAKGLSELQTSIADCLNDIIDEASDAADVARVNLLDLVVSGNTTMAHLLLGVSPESLGRAPYTPVFLSSPPVRFSDIELRGNEEAHLSLVPGISGFAGGDTVAGILATGMHRSDELGLLIDIGTNGEIVIGNRERLVAASAAAGPAFEGGRIEKGMRAEVGAIDHVRIGDDVTVTTVGGDAARGICGSGLIEAVAGMLSRGLIRRDGRMVSSDETGDLPGGLAGRFDGAGGKRRFILSESGAGSVYVTQKDIGEVQLAKGAIRAAVEILLYEWGAEPGDIHEVLVAGAFGFNLRAEDLKVIGLLPEVDVERIRFVGNTSLEGALMVLLSERCSGEAEEIPSMVEYVELAGRGDFERLFVESMGF